MYEVSSVEWRDSRCAGERVKKESTSTVVCRDFLNRQRAKSEALGRHASVLDECAGEGRIHAGQTKWCPRTVM
jgi:hypothetical protein